MDWTDLLLLGADAPDYIVEDGEDNWVCKCGNSSESDGFQPCDHRGLIVEPSHTEWDGIHYLCERCFRIIDNATLQVMGRCDDAAVQTNNEWRFAY